MTMREQKGSKKREGQAEPERSGSKDGEGTKKDGEGEERGRWRKGAKVGRERRTLPMQEERRCTTCAAGSSLAD